MCAFAELWDGAALQHVFFLKPPIMLTSHQHQSWLCSGARHQPREPSRNLQQRGDRCAPLSCSPQPLVGMEPHAHCRTLGANDTWGTKPPAWAGHDGHVLVTSLVWPLGTMSPRCQKMNPCSTPESQLHPATLHAKNHEKEKTTKRSHFYLGFQLVRLDKYSETQR